METMNMETAEVIKCPLLMGYTLETRPVKTNPMVSPEDTRLVERIIKFHDTQAGEIIYNRYAQKVFEIMEALFGKDQGEEVAHRFWAHLWINKTKTTDIPEEARRFARNFQRKTGIQKKYFVPLAYIYSNRIKVIDPSYSEESEESLED